MADVQILDENGEVVEHPDLNAGYVSNEYIAGNSDGEFILVARTYHRHTTETKKAEENAELERQMRAAIIMFTRKNVSTMSDEDAQNVSMLFPDWRVSGSYEQGDILRFNGGLYRVSQKVTDAQADHTPDKAVSLYKKIGEPTGGPFPWSQPQGAHDAYKKGDKVSHTGKTWVSTVDNNVWEPGVYGWEEVKE